VASVLAWRLLREWLAPLAALAGALLFAVHPLHVEAVANVVGRAELMMTAFVLGALLLHRRGSPWALAAFALALLSKENGIVLPGLALAHDLLLPDADGPVATLRARRRLYAGYVVLAVAYLALLAWLFHGTHFVSAASTWNGATTAERLLTMATVVPEYLRLLVAPFALSIDYTPDVVPLVTTFTPAAALGTLVVALAVLLTATTWRRAPLVALALLWFGVAISPVANVLFPSGIVLAERTLYLPSLAIVLLAGLGAQQLAAHERGRLAAALVLAIGAAYAVRSWTRTPTWKDNKALVLTVLSEHPESYRAHAFAASVHWMREDWSAAARELEIARRIFQRDPWVYHRSAETALQLGDVRGAAAFLDTAVALAPERAAVHLRRAEVRFRLGDFSGAMRGALHAMTLAPDSMRAAHVVAAAAHGLGDAPTAIQTYRRALDRAPRDADLHAGYASVLRAVGDLPRARLHADSAALLRRSAASAGPPAGTPHAAPR